MPRGIRIIIADICHHAIQRGNNRQDVFNAEEDRLYYLEWARKIAQQYQVAIIGYCLMTNHIHLLVIPRSVGWHNRLYEVISPEIHPIR